jgi:hypothetical protein
MCVFDLKVAGMGGIMISTFPPNQHAYGVERAEVSAVVEWLMSGWRLQNTTPLLPTLHDLGAHLKQAILSLAFRQDLECLRGAVDVFLRESTSLLDAVACNDKVASLGLE